MFLTALTLKCDRDSNKKYFNINFGYREKLILKRILTA